MFVGFLRKPKEPSFMAKFLAITCINQGIKLIYFTPDDVSIKSKTVKGKMYHNSEWISVETELPRFIDINPHLHNSIKYRKVLNFLKKNTRLSIDRRHVILEDDLQKQLKESSKFAHIAIPTIELRSYENLIEAISKFHTIVIKPVRGLKGKGIFILKSHAKSFSLGSQKEEKKISETELLKLYNDTFAGNGYVIQKYICSRTLQGDPFDCRIHLEKNGEGKWAAARIFIRIGIGQKVVSNISQGGGISNPKPFLKANYRQKYENIYEKIEDLAITLPYEIEKITKKKFTTMGLDIGIDKDGKLFIFEINSYPIVAPQLSEIALLRAEHFKYILEGQEIEKKLCQLKRSRNQLILTNKKLKKKKEKLQKRVDSYEKSNSWKITKPLRKIRKFNK